MHFTQMRLLLLLALPDMAPYRHSNNQSPQPAYTKAGAMLEGQRSQHACKQAFMLSARNIVTLRLFTPSVKES